MIIGINGKIGSGKDTVGKIIQWLTKPELDGQYIGFQTYDNITLERCSPFKIKKFAGKLKQIGSILSGIVADQFEDQEFKKLYMGVDWDMTYREFLQKLGTEAMRDGLHENTWVNALFADYKAKWIPTGNAVEEDEVSLEIEYPNWIITDMRFPNEMEAVEKRHGITIRVNRTTFRTTETEFGKLSVVNQPKVDKLLGIQEHPSETALDDAEFDYEIINDGTIEELVKKVREILIKENII